MRAVAILVLFLAIVCGVHGASLPTCSDCKYECNEIFQECAGCSLLCISCSCRISTMGVVWIAAISGAGLVFLVGLGCFCHSLCSRPAAREGQDRIIVVNNTTHSAPQQPAPLQLEGMRQTLLQ